MGLLSKKGWPWLMAHPAANAHFGSIETPLRWRTPVENTHADEIFAQNGEIPMSGAGGSFELAARHGAGSAIKAGLLAVSVVLFRQSRGWACPILRRHLGDPHPFLRECVRGEGHPP